MSRQQQIQPVTVKQEDVIEIDDDDDDDTQYRSQLLQALEESRSTSQPPVPTAGPLPSASFSGAQASSHNTFLSDRAQLERDRLARQKRLRPGFAENTTDRIKQEDDEDDLDTNDTRDTKRQRVSPTIAHISRANTSCSRAQVHVYPTNKTAEAPFYDGELRQNANQLVDPAKDRKPVFRLTEILSPVSTHICP